MCVKDVTDGGSGCCRCHGDCVSNNNGDTGFVTALIFSVVTEQTIGVCLLRLSCCATTAVA